MSAPRVTLHIGLPKCASSSLQRHFATCAAIHARQGLCYPETARETQGYLSHRPLLDGTPDAIAKTVHQIRQEATAKHCPQILLSTEEIANSRFRNPGALPLIEELNRVFGAQNVTLLILLRNPFDFVESAFAQLLKGGIFGIRHDEFFSSTTHDITAFLDIIRNRNGFDLASLADWVDLTRRAAPENPLQTLSVERADLNGHDITTHLEQHFGVAAKPTDTRINARFSDKALLALRHAHKHHGPDRTRRQRNRLARLFRTAPNGFSPDLHLHGPAFDHVAATAARDRERLAPTQSTALDAAFSIPSRYADDTRASHSTTLTLGDRVLVRTILKLAPR